MMTLMCASLFGAATQYALYTVGRLHVGIDFHTGDGIDDAVTIHFGEFGYAHFREQYTESKIETIRNSHRHFVQFFLYNYYYYFFIWRRSIFRK